MEAWGLDMGHGAWDLEWKNGAAPTFWLQDELMGAACASINTVACTAT